MLGRGKPLTAEEIFMRDKYMKCLQERCGHLVKDSIEDSQCRGEHGKKCVDMLRLKYPKLPSKTEIKAGFNTNPIFITLLILGIGYVIFRQS